MLFIKSDTTEHCLRAGNITYLLRAHPNATQTVSLQALALHLFPATATAAVLPCSCISIILCPYTALPCPTLTGNHLEHHHSCMWLHCMLIMGHIIWGPPRVGTGVILCYQDLQESVPLSCPHVIKGDYRNTGSTYDLHV